jgi:hypothetical protein
VLTLTNCQKVTELRFSGTRWSHTGTPIARLGGRMWQAHEFMRRIGTVLRIRDEDFAHEPLPERWVDLIHYLDEKERREKAGERQRRQPN